MLLSGFDCRETQLTSDLKQAHIAGNENPIARMTTAPDSGCADLQGICSREGEPLDQFLRSLPYMRGRLDLAPAAAQVFEHENCLHLVFGSDLAHAEASSECSAHFNWSCPPYGDSVPPC
jgi:hypothetical protein